MSRRQHIALSAGLLVIAALFLANAWPSLESAVDDAYISARYAHHLAEGHGLVYNVGEAIEGYTNLAWVLYLAAGLSLGLDVHGLMVWGSLVCGVVLLLTLTGLAATLLGRWDPRVLLAPLLVALLPQVAVAATNGLETSLWLAALAGAIWATLAAERRGRVPAGLLVGLLCTIRPEGLAVAGILGAYDLWRHRRALAAPGTWTLSASVALVIAALTLWRLATYGALVPNTFAAKVSKSLWERILGNLDYLNSYGPLWYLVWAALLLLLLLPPRRIERALIGVIAVLLTGVALWVHLWMPGGRLLLSGLVLGAALAPAVLSEGRRWRRGLAVALVLGAAVALIPPFQKFERHFDRRVGVVPASHSKVVGEHLAAHLPPGSTVVVRDAGGLAYWVGTGVRVAELHPRALTQLHPDHGVADFDSYVPEDVEAIVTTTRDRHAPAPKYRPDKKLLRRKGKDYAHYGRFEHHLKRYYDLYVRADLDVPPLPEEIIISRAGAELAGGSR